MVACLWQRCCPCCTSLSFSTFRENSEAGVSVIPEWLHNGRHVPMLGDLASAKILAENLVLKEAKFKATRQIVWVRSWVISHEEKKGGVLVKLIIFLFFTLLSLFLGPEVWPWYGMEPGAAPCPLDHLPGITVSISENLPNGGFQHCPQEGSRYSTITLIVHAL